MFFSSFLFAAGWHILIRSSAEVAVGEGTGERAGVAPTYSIINASLQAFRAIQIINATVSRSTGMRRIVPDARKGIGCLGGAMHVTNEPWFPGSYVII